MSVLEPNPGTPALSQKNGINLGLGPHLNILKKPSSWFLTHSKVENHLSKVSKMPFIQYSV